MRYVPFLAPGQKASFKEHLTLIDGRSREVARLVILYIGLDSALDRDPARGRTSISRAFRSASTHERVRAQVHSVAIFEDAADLFRAAAAAPETILAFRAVRGVASVNEDSHQKRSDGRERLHLGQTTVQNGTKFSARL